MEEGSFEMIRNKGSGLECNICLDMVHDPVVTLCGHLYCWACIYKWMIQHSQTSCCPVCKSKIFLETSLVPLYARGQTRKVVQQNHYGLIVPKRPLSPTTCSSSSTVTLEEAVFAKIFGISGQISNSYHHMLGNGDHTSSLMEKNKWFKRVCSFLCCFILVCLVLF